MLANVTTQYHRVWLRAYEQGEFVIECRDKAEASRIRFGLYGAVKGIKTSAIDSPLRTAALNCGITFLSPTTLCISRVTTGDFLQSILGEEQTPALLTEDDIIAASQARLQGLIG